MWISCYHCYYTVYTAEPPGARYTAAGVLDTNPMGQTVLFRIIFLESKCFSPYMLTRPKIWLFVYAYALPPEDKSSRRSRLKPKKSCKRVNIFIRFSCGHYLTSRIDVKTRNDTSKVPRSVPSIRPPVLLSSAPRTRKMTATLRTQDPPQRSTQICTITMCTAKIIP